MAASDFERAVRLIEDCVHSMIFQGQLYLLLGWLEVLPRNAHCAGALRHDEEQSYIDDTFKHFWLSAKAQHLELTSLAGVLRYLRLCLNSVLIDTLRTYARKHIQSLPEPDSADELLVEESYHENEWWRGH